MDDRRFDALTRALAQGSSRRTALKGLIGGLVGGIAVTTGTGRAGAGVVEECDCPVVACQSVRCEGESCIYEDNCEDACTQCNTSTGVCDPKICGPCEACSRGVCFDTCGDGGKCCDDLCVPECCTDQDCPSYEDQCGTNYCIDGVCDPRNNCTTSQRCCGFGTSGAYCADECCSDQDCPGCEICNISGICEETECCGDSDCVSVCGDCVEGTCVPRCTGDDYCCAYANDCRAPGDCCTDDDCPCGGACSDGTCYPQPPCPEGEECCGDECVPLGQCVHLCLPEGRPL